MKTLKLYFLIIISLIFSNCFAQKEANIWYFGQYAGLDFNDGEPVALTNSAMSQHEGCATISDPGGNLLFYTDGMTVWNKQHQVMLNGTGLMGHISATQSGVIVPRPGSNNLYYIFTVPAEIGNSGLRYSVVDLTLNGGLGAVTSQKNIYLTGPCEEKITAVKHNNNFDIWVITHNWNSDNFIAYLVTSGGINTSPVISNIGTFHTGPDVHGSMKVSPDGKKLAIIVRQIQSFELFDFNNTTGVVSNTITFQPNYYTAYGIEFSPDCSKLYVSKYNNGSHIFQFDLNAGDSLAIINSGTIIGTVSNIHLGALQLAPNNKIYVSKHDNFSGDSYLGVINQPNIQGAGCDFVEDGFYLEGKKCFWGLPNFIQSYFRLFFTYEPNCFGDSTNFTLTIPYTADSLIWDFGDPSTGNQNFSHEYNPSHVFSSPGEFFVTLTVYANGDSNTLTQIVEINSIPEIFLGNDTTICSSDSLILNAGSGYETYYWQDDSSDSIFIASDSGLYWVEVTDSNGCNAADSIMLTVIPVQNVFLGNDTTICIGSFLELNAGSGFDSYLWQDGTTDSVYLATQSGNYWVEVSDICGVSSDTINVTFAPGFSINLGNDTTFCADDSLILNAGSGYETYLWQDDSSDSIFIAYETGLYWVEVADSNGCIALDSILLIVLPVQNVFLGNDTTLCYGSFLELIPGSGYDSYLWQDGSMDSVFLATQSGNYWVEVSNICGVSSDTIDITFFPDIYINLGNDTSFCYGNSIILDPGSGFENYLWQNGSFDSVFIASSTGYYWVEVTDTNSCTAIDSVFINVVLEYEISIGNDTSTICEGDYLFLDPGSGFDSYLWQDGSSYQTFIADTAGIYWVEVADINSCSARDSILLIVNIIPENFLGNDTIICPGDIVTINAGGDFFQYLWQDNSSDSVFLADSIGTYWVYVEDEIGCSGSDTIVLFPFIPPSLNLQNEVRICEGDSITFNASPGYSFYNWQDGSNDSVFRAFDEGLYWVNILTECGIYSDSVLLSFYENAYLNLGNDTIICKDETIKLNAGTGFSEYLWQDGSDKNDFYVTETGIYWVKIFDGNCYASDTIFIDECSSLWVPNVFTPNGDNYNDYFYAVGNKITKFRMEIFNRWGRKLKTLNNINDKWDGKYKGNKCPQGVYFWIADFEIYDKSEKIINKIMNGSVTLQR